MTVALTFEVQDILRVRANRALINFPADAKLDHLEVAFLAALPGERDPLAHKPLVRLVQDELAVPAAKPDTSQCLALRKCKLTEAGKIRRAELRELVGVDQ